MLTVLTQTPLFVSGNRSCHTAGPAPLPWRISTAGREDRRRDYGEDRYLLLGMVQDHLLAVVYAQRGARVRIISARLAEPQERRRYHEENR
jgi:uncharacterized DUF497 family protein